MATRPMCTIPDCTDPTHYGCLLRAKGVRVSPKVETTRTQNWRPTPADPTPNKQIMYDERPGGTKMPILNPDGSVVRIRQYERERKQITSKIRRLRNGDGDFTSNRTA